MAGSAEDRLVPLRGRLLEGRRPASLPSPNASPRIFGPSPGPAGQTQTAHSPL